MVTLVEARWLTSRILPEINNMYCFVCFYFVHPLRVAKAASPAAASATDESKHL